MPEALTLVNQDVGNEQVDVTGSGGEVRCDSGRQCFDAAGASGPGTTLSCFAIHLARWPPTHKQRFNLCAQLPASRPRWLA